MSFTHLQPLHESEVNSRAYDLLLGWCREATLPTEAIDFLQHNLVERESWLEEVVSVFWREVVRTDTQPQRKTINYSQLQHLEFSIGLERMFANCGRGQRNQREQMQTWGEPNMGVRAGD